MLSSSLTVQRTPLSQIGLAVRCRKKKKNDVTYARLSGGSRDRGFPFSNAHFTKGLCKSQDPPRSPSRAKHTPGWSTQTTLRHRTVQTLKCRTYSGRIKLRDRSVVQRHPLVS
eukprot:1902989-Rhodomonas_salina.1